MTGIVAALAMSRRHVSLLVALALGGALAAATAAAAPTPNGLQDRVSHARDRERALRGSINSDTIRINGFQGRLDDLLKRLAGIQGSLDSERADLGRPDLDVDAIARREWRSVFVNYRQRGMFSRIGLG